MPSTRKAPPAAKLDWPEATNPDWNWLGVFERNVTFFEALAKRNCRVEASRHFLRAPFWQENGDEIVLGDLRGDYFEDPKKWGKYTFTKSEQWPCDSLQVPVWTPPFFRASKGLRDQAQSGALAPSGG